MCHNCYHCSEDYACCNDDTYMCAEQQGQRYDTSFPKYSEGSSCNEITHQLCEIPTNDPTNIPTFTKVTQGSFEIHSIGDVTGEALSGTFIELLDMYNGSNRVHDTTVLSPDCITKFSGPVVAEAFQVETTPADVVSLGNKWMAILPSTVFSVFSRHRHFLLNHSSCHPLFRLWWWTFE